MRVLLLLESTTEQKEGLGTTPALDLYTSRDHVEALQGATSFWRNRKYAVGDLEVKVISPRYGLVSGTQQVERYADSFQGQNDALLRKNAELLGVPRALRLALNSGYYNLCIFLASRATYLVSGLNELQSSKTPVVCICPPDALAEQAATIRLLGVSPSFAQVRQLGLGPHNVRGVLVGRLLFALANEKATTNDLLCMNAQEVLSLLGA